MWQWSECARKAIDAPIYAIVKTKSKLAKNLLLGLWIPGECSVEDGCIRGAQSKSPGLNVVAQRHVPTLRKIDYSLHRAIAGARVRADAHGTGASGGM
jgi:hypothetical protein